MTLLTYNDKGPTLFLTVWETMLRGLVSSTHTYAGTVIDGKFHWTIGGAEVSDSLNPILDEMAYEVINTPQFNYLKTKT